MRSVSSWKGVRGWLVLAAGLLAFSACQGEKSITGPDIVYIGADGAGPTDVPPAPDTSVADTGVADTSFDASPKPDTSVDPCLEHCTNGQADCGEAGVDCGGGCGPCSACGDGSCDPGETPSSCCQDCAPCCTASDCTGCALTEIASCNSGYCFCTEQPENCGDGTCSPGETACGCPQDCTQLCGDGCCSGDETACGCPQECPSQCGDGCCSQGESACGCPGECASKCGDGCCTTGETACGCPQECAPTCGDGCCSGGETACTCPGECGSQCGDGCCSAGETAAGCCGDCGQCCTKADCPACPNGGQTVCTQGQCSCTSGPDPDPVTCGDKKCAPGKEDCGTCPGDCPCPTGTTCKNNQCVDPGVEPGCGDKKCAPGVEDCGTCPGDCPCPKNTTCQNHQCVNTCTSNCAGKNCGDDGCGGSCGSCSGTDKCNSNGQCVANCTSNCTGKNCGNDGCGGSCGSCSGTDTCNSNGQCVANCTSNCTGKNCGNDGCGGLCGSCTGTDTCNSNGQCVCTPQCAGKACGNNGCGGSCGSCTGTDTCQNNQCVPKVTPVGFVPNFTASCGGCTDGEACVMGQCAPVAVILVSGDTAPSFVCPTGYSQAGRWRTSGSWADGYVDGQDTYGYLSDGGWAYLCSAKPSSVFMASKSSDCGDSTTPCSNNNAQGDFHVGQGCSMGAAAVDGKGKTLKAGWMRLCVEDGSQVKLQTTISDCGESVSGCGGWPVKGRWHTTPGSCTSGPEAADASGKLIESGWISLCVNSGRYPASDPATINNKALFGYQGWFAAPGDGANVGWRHWFHAGTTPTQGNATFDLWPDMSELDADERFDTSLTLPNGQTAQLFSSAIQKTVRRHFRWMAETGIDGVFMQRFISELKDPAHFALRNKITSNVAAGATEHGRVFALMYDISGISNANFQTQGVEGIKNDWEYLVDTMGMTDSPAYLHQGGKPVVAIWGFGFNDRPGTVAEATQLINYFQSTAKPQYRAYVVGGVPFDWRSGGGNIKPGFLPVFEKFDALSPWSVGRYPSTSVFDSNFPIIQGDKSHTAAKGIGYAPVAWPGFSWVNLKKTFNEFNKIPRNGGKFFWYQARKLHSINPTFLYIAMFDEVDESTAMFKAATQNNQTPTSGTWLHLGQDGYNLPSDWYLRLGGAITGAMDGRYTPKGDLPFDPP